MEIKNFEPSVGFDKIEQHTIREACEWVGSLFTMKVKEKDLAFVTVKQACDILNEIKSGMLFTQDCNNKANHEDHVVDIAIDLVDVLRNNYEVASNELGEDFVLF